ncbi:MAG: mraZ [Verrucomicrobiales bacterium]|jgi:MraZ protein|nr:mraZ [Verrucomicrobiales bacterium]
MAEAEFNVPSFHGDFRYGIDDSRRVMIPAKWRPKDPSVVFTVILWPIGVEDFLLVLPPERWQVMLDKLKAKSLHDKRVATLERVIGASSAPLTLDRVGRFVLPEHLAKPAGIEKEAQFVGRLDKFEMWSPVRYQAANADDKSLAASVAAEIDL